MNHHCHALGCGNACPPKWLMCSLCWAHVPPQLKSEVTRTCKLRNKEYADASWAPWWRAQAKATYHVAMLREPSDRGKQWLAHQLALADKLAAKAE